MMKQKNFNSVAGIVFLIVAVSHVFRVFNGWEAIIGGWDVPIKVSWVAIIIAAYLAYSGLRLARKG